MKKHNLTRSEQDRVQRSFTKPIIKLYEDEALIAFEKPSGLLVVPTAKEEEKTLTNIVNFQFRLSDDSWKLHPCHRLDRETSGVILYAKGKKIQQSMMKIFQERGVEKKYLAFIWGKPRKRSGEINRPVRHREKKNFRPDSIPLQAITKYKVIEQYKHFALVEVVPVTGRTNQIRLHFSDYGQPLVGERKYAVAKDYPFRFKRVALHAAELRFDHPVTGERVKIRSELPEDMGRLLTK